MGTKAIARKAYQSKAMVSSPTETAKVKHKTEEKKSVSPGRDRHHCVVIELSLLISVYQTTPEWIYRARNKQKPGLFD